MYLTSDGRFRKTGIKNTNITGEIDGIISSARRLLVIGGYNFTKLSSPRSVLRKIINAPVAAKHCILPIQLYGGSDRNRQLAIELVQSGVSERRFSTSALHPRSSCR